MTAAYALGYFIKAPFKFNLQQPDNLPQILVAIQEAILFDKGVTGVSESELRALDELRQRYDRLNSDYASQIKLNEELHKQASDAFDTQRTEQAESFNTLFGQAKSTLESITDTYDKEMALKASVSYWSAKAVKHRNMSALFGLAFVVVIVAAGIWFYNFIHPFLDKVQPGTVPPYWILTMMAILAVVLIWIARIIVRVLLSHIHLQRDSTERVTMLQTYLALLREGTGLEKGDKELILESLFHPSPSGIIKDDALPSSIYDLLTRTGSRS